MIVYDGIYRFATGMDQGFKPRAQWEHAWQVRIINLGLDQSPVEHLKPMIVVVNQTGSKPIDLDILFDQDYGSVAVDRIPVESRYIEKHRLAADRSEIPVADRLVRDQQRLDRRRAGKEIWQRA